MIRRRQLAAEMAPGRLLGLLVSGAITPPRRVMIDLPHMTYQREHAFGETFLLSAQAGGDWHLERVEHDGRITKLGLVRELLGWRPTGAPVGGWK